MEIKRILSRESLYTLCYVGIAAIFSFVAITYKSIEWKVFATGLVFASVLCIVNHVSAWSKLARLEKNSESDLENIKSQIEFREHLFAILPMGIVFYAGAVYSLVRPGVFLPTSTCLMLILIPTVSLYRLHKRSKASV